MGERGRRGRREGDSTADGWDEDEGSRKRTLSRKRGVATWMGRKGEEGSSDCLEREAASSEWIKMSLLYSLIDVAKSNPFAKESK